MIFFIFSPQPPAHLPELWLLSLSLPNPSSARIFPKVKIYLPKLQQFSYFLTSGIYSER